MTRTERMNFVIEPDLKKEAEKVSKQTGMPVSVLIRRGLRFELSKHKRNDIPTLDELMLDKFELLED